MHKSLKTVIFYILTTVTMLTFATIFSRSVDAFSEQNQSHNQVCIVIDPGHGGEDGGAVSCSGIPESMYNLDISIRLKDLLCLLGYETKMIRNTDISVYTAGETLAQKKASDLKHRVQIVNNTPGAVLLSIHQNHFHDSQYTGAQVFYGKTEGSEQLAKQLQREFLSKLNPESHREAKKSSGIYLMEHIRCPGILIECGFLSNPQEEAMLRNPAYQKKIIAIVATTVSQYLSNT